jgi:hypothetical protein
MQEIRARTQLYNTLRVALFVEICNHPARKFPDIFSAFVRPAPRPQVDPIKSDAKHIGGNEPELIGAKSDEADHNAVDCRQNPAFPTTAAYKNG